MSSVVIVSTIVAYVALLLGVSYLSSRKADNKGFFIGNRRTRWHVATLAMIGAAMSGVTFISVPGSVAADSMTYMQMVVGFTIGQMIVAFLLVPLFYRLGVVSLYEYLDRRFGIMAHKTGAWCFLIAKLIGASLKIFVVCAVLQLLLFEGLDIPFWLTASLVMLCVWLYTRKGGVRALIPTDIIQSLCLVGSVVVSVVALARAMGLDSMSEVIDAVAESPYSQIWQTSDSSSPRYLWKMVAGGVLCLVAMTGLDQDMMQRNMSCRKVRDAQANIVLTAICQIFVILLLLTLGVLLYRYVDFASLSVPKRGDDVYPFVAIYGGLPSVVGVMFILGLISSTYSAAGSALTSLTTSFTLDIKSDSLGLDEDALAVLRRRVHAVMALLMTTLVVVLNYISNESLINLIFKIAGYTYGPILGLFVFGMATRRSLRHRFIPVVAILSPLLSGVLQWVWAEQFQYYIFLELLGYNALITIVDLMAISRPAK